MSKVSDKAMGESSWSDMMAEKGLKETACLPIAATEQAHFLDLKHIKKYQ